MKLTQLAEPIPGREYGSFLHVGEWVPRLVPWPNRFWRSAWVTESGYIITVWVDEAHAVTVLRARVESEWRKRIGGAP